jgi:transcriptional regulator with XRE-family HTH domain
MAETTLAGRILAELHARGWSQRRLSERAGLSHGTVNDLVNHPERAPRPATIAAIEAAFGLPEGALAQEGQGGKGHLRELRPEELATMGPGGALMGLAALAAGGTRWRAYIHRAPGARGARVLLVDTRAEMRAGDVALAETREGAGPHLYLPPHLVQRDGSDAVTPAEGGGAVILGRLVLSVCFPSM